MTNIKKNIYEDWRNSFPSLTLYSQNKLYKIVGPVIVGIELIKLPRTEEYRPHFVCYPLWKKDTKDCLKVPILLREFYNRRGFQFSIPYAKHHIYFSEVFEQATKQIPFSFEADLYQEDLLSYMDKISGMPPLSAAPNSYLQAELQEYKLALALYTNNNIQIQKILYQIRNKNWDLNHFASCNVDFQKWLQSLQDRVSHRDEFLNQIEKNRQNKKIAKLKRSELKA